MPTGIRFEIAKTNPHNSQIRKIILPFSRMFCSEKEVRQLSHIEVASIATFDHDTSLARYWIIGAKRCMSVYSNTYLSQKVVLTVNMNEREEIKL